MVLGGIGQFFGRDQSLIKSIIVAIYTILFGVSNALLGMSQPLNLESPVLIPDGLVKGGRKLKTDTRAEFQIPPQVARYASFMFSFIGRGVCE